MFDRVSSFLYSLESDETLSSRLLSPSSSNTIFFLHLLGLDTTGHSKRPYSEQYLRNIEIVDKGISKLYEAFERIFDDQRTAYILTSDHGMSDKGF